MTARPVTVAAFLVVFACAVLALLAAQAIQPPVVSASPLQTPTIAAHGWFSAAQPTVTPAGTPTPNYDATLAIVRIDNERKLGETQREIAIAQATSDALGTMQAGAAQRANATAWARETERSQAITVTAAAPTLMVALADAAAYAAEAEADANTATLRSVAGALSVISTTSALLLVAAFLWRQATLPNRAKPAAPAPAPTASAIPEAVDWSEWMPTLEQMAAVREIVRGIPAGAPPILTFSRMVRRDEGGSQPFSRNEFEAFRALAVRISWAEEPSENEPWRLTLTEAGVSEITGGVAPQNV